MSNSEETKTKKKVDRRLVYILPSILALAMALTCCLFQFGNYLVDLQNTCYTIFVSVPEDMPEDECISKIEDVLFDADISGFTILKNTRGGTINEDGTLVEDTSYQVLLMSVPRVNAERTALMLQKVFGNRDVMIEETTIKNTYLTGSQSDGEK